MTCFALFLWIDRWICFRFTMQLTTNNGLCEQTNALSRSSALLVESNIKLERKKQINERGLRFGKHVINNGSALLTRALRTGLPLFEWSYRLLSCDVSQNKLQVYSKFIPYVEWTLRETEIKRGFVKMWTLDSPDSIVATILSNYQILSTIE